MPKSFDITSEVFEKLDYDEIGNIPKEENTMKQIAGYKIEKFTIPEITVHNAAGKIRHHINHLAAIEAEDNCIPFHIAERHINLSLIYFDGGLTHKPRILDNIPSFTPMILALHEFSLLEVLHELYLTLECGCFEFKVKYNAGRQKFINYLICDVLEGKKTMRREEWEIPKHEITDHNPYTTMFVFESGDLDSAAHYVASSFDDPLIPWRVRSIYVQENCYETFCEKLKVKLRGYPLEILRDKVFVNNFMVSYNVIEKLKATTIQPSKIHYSGDVFPTICCEFNRDHFDTPSSLSPIVIIKSIRTVKEAITLAKRETGGLASIWTENHSIAYEIINKMDFSTYWINCLGVLDKSIPFTVREHSNCLGSDFALYEWLAKYQTKDTIESPTRDYNQISEALKSESKIINSYHFEFITTEKKTASNHPHYEEHLTLLDLIDLSDVYWKNVHSVITHYGRKTIVFPFGITFGN